MIQIIAIKEKSVKAKVITGGIIRSNKGISVDRPISLSNFTEKDLEVIKIANDLGMKTVRFRFGKYSKLEARDDSEKADFEIKNLRELLEIVDE